MRIKALRCSRHCWLCVPTIPAVAVDCCVFVLHCWQYSHLSLIQGTVTCSMPAQQHYLSPLTTVPLHLFSNMMIHVIVWMVGWPDITTLQRFRDIYHCILLLVLSPAGDIVAGIVLSALQSIISTLRNVSRLLSILHPTPPTAYYLLLSWLRPLVVGSSFMV